MTIRQELDAQRTNSVLDVINHDFYMMDLEYDYDEQIRILAKIIELKKAKQKQVCLYCHKSLNTPFRVNSFCCHDHELRYRQEMKH